MKLLPLSIVSFGLAWDYLNTASDIGNLIDKAHSVNPSVDTGDIESEKNRKTVLGITFLAVGIINAVITFQSVEVGASPNSVSIAYRF